MKFFINSMGFYFLLPVYTALALLLVFFNIPQSYYRPLFIFYTLITVPVLFCILILPMKIELNNYFDAIKKRLQYRVICLSMCLLILLCGPLDVYVNGFKLLNPSTYADLHGIGRYIRHITILCWVLIPIAFLYLRSPLTKLFFIGYAVIFPILIIDRNRFFISCYSLVLCIALVYGTALLQRVKSKGKIWFFCVPIACFLIFAILGHFRSGAAFIVPSSGTLLRENMYPLATYFAALPTILQQIVLYITTPIFNFATVAADNFINTDFLLSQLSPFNRDSYPVYPYAPILVGRFNVGTEFYPFLLYGGISMVAWAFIFMLITFILAFSLFKKCPNIFTFLIFIRISYNVLFMGFAPQFYILLNLAFVLLMLFLWFFAELIRISGNIEQIKNTVAARVRF